MLSFVVFRFGVIIFIYASMYLDRHRVSIPYVLFLLVCVFLMNIINVVLFKRPRLRAIEANTMERMALVDHKLGEERYINIIDLAQKADIVLAHDAEIRGAGNYKYVEKKVTDHYTYVCKMSMLHTDDLEKDGYTSTLIMSNFIDLTFLEQVFKSIMYNRKVIACDYKNF